MQTGEDTVLNPFVKVSFYLCCFLATKVVGYLNVSVLYINTVPCILGILEYTRGGSRRPYTLYVRQSELSLLLCKMIKISSNDIIIDTLDTKCYIIMLNLFHTDNTLAIFVYLLAAIGYILLIFMK